MKVFEDLIEELKEENLLETTIIDRPDPNGLPNHLAALDQDGREDGRDRTPISDGFQMSAESVGDPIAKDSEDMPSIEKAATGREFFRKRAMDEVSSLQMVQLVLMGVEREHMKLAPEPYNELKAKKALHMFLQASERENAGESTDAEYDLLQETQKWYSALAERDKEISVSNIRRFCENSRPVLSSQALISLARFYRNSPFSDRVRGKFDFVMTRLFARETNDELRRLLFDRKEMIGHIRTLYQNWSSIELFTLGENSGEIEGAISKFAEFTVEAEDLQHIDEMLKRGIFERIRAYKTDIGELFFVPEVAAAAITCNVRLGNRFVELVAAAKSSLRIYELEEKYGDLGHLVSSITGKSFSIEEILRNQAEEGDDRKSQYKFAEAQNPSGKTASKAKDRSPGILGSVFGVNKLLAGATLIVIIASIGIYVWANMVSEEATSKIVAQDIELTDPDIKQHLRVARTSNETFYGVTQPSWDALPNEEKKEFLKRITSYAGERGLSKVNLLNYKGRTVAFSNKYRSEILPPS
jgi:hypothetical protein